MSMKKKILIVGAFGLLSFGVSLGLSLLLGGEKTQSGPAELSGEDDLVAGKDNQVAASLASLTSLSPREKELASLIRQVQMERAELEKRQRELELEARRIEMLRKDLQADAAELEKRRVQLIPILRDIRDAEVALEKTQTLIKETERLNFQQIAATYEKMKPDSAAQTLAAMIKNGQEADATKILYFMRARAAGGVLQKFEDPMMAAEITERLKRIRQEGD
jgi:flagellar motility protein MotE (MotC chaperone)